MTAVNVICTVNRDFSCSVLFCQQASDYKSVYAFVFSNFVKITEKLPLKTIYDLFCKGSVYLLSLKLDGK